MKSVHSPLKAIGHWESQGSVDWILTSTWPLEKQVSSHALFPVDQDFHPYLMAYKEKNTRIWKQKEQSSSFYCTIHLCNLGQVTYAL